MEIKSNRLDYETAIMGLKQTLQYGNSLKQIMKGSHYQSLKQTLQYGNIKYDFHNWTGQRQFKIDFIVWKFIFIFNQF